MRRVLGVWFLSLWGGAGWAAPTQLNVIPTTDIVPLHQGAFALQNGNTSLNDRPTLFHRLEPLFQFQFGLSPALEAGVDAVPADPPGNYRPQFNVKWKMLAEDYGRPALGLGLAQLGPGFSSSSYLVASRTLNYQQIQYQKFRAHHRNIKLRGRRIHAGLTHGQGRTFPLLGTDWEISDHFVFYSDWISGGDNALSLGGVYVVNTDTSVQVALLYGNHAQRLNGLLVNFNRNFKWGGK